jgi:DnaJ-like protein
MTHYDLLGLQSTATVDEIKQAFRRQIAKYHPDKVQHLGAEFQDIAAVRSAELTQAYKTLTDEDLRADYDVRMRSAPIPHLQGHSVTTANSESAGQPESVTAAVRTGVSDLVQKASLARFRQALHAEFGASEEDPVGGFDVICAPSKRRLWSRLPPRMYVRFVRYVDATEVSTGRTMLLRVVSRGDLREVCLVLMAHHVAPASELVPAVAREQRKTLSFGVALTIVPVNTRNWSAYLPSSAPPAIRSLLARLQST